MSSLYSLEETRQLILQGKPLLLAGEEALLAKLPKGPWIGGTTPYFMAEDGGKEDRDKVFVTPLPAFAQMTSIKSYDPDQITEVAQDYAPNGCSFIIMPAGSNIHLAFAKDSSNYTGIFNSPLAGWIAGVHLSELGKTAPKVVNGQTGECFEDQAVVMHIALPPTKVARIDIINLFQPGKGDTITFPETAFEVKDCLVNGSKTTLASYMLAKGIDPKLPLVADYSGAAINVSVQRVDPDKDTVRFYAAVFSGTEYRFAEPVPDFGAAFARELALHSSTPTFSCNCILNYLFAGLQGAKTGHLLGPITFGEVAYILLNQTLVYLSFEDL